MTVTVEQVFTAAHILPMLREGERTEGLAVVVSGGRILEVCDAVTGFGYVQQGVQHIDLGERILMPGFVDPHAHTEVAALTQFGVVDVRVPHCSSISEVLQVLRDSLGQVTDGWLVAQGNLFFDRKLSDGRFPTRSELDSVSQEIPIIVRAGGHLSILNSRALELAGIGRDFVPPFGSVTGQPVVEQDLGGTPTGVVMEMDNLIPFPRTPETQTLAALESGVAELFTRYGVTTIGEISESIGGLGAFRAGIERGSIPTRMSVYLWVPGTVSLSEATNPQFLEGLRGKDPARFDITGVKVFADGGFSAAQAGISTDYVHAPGQCGSVALAPDEIAKLYRATQQTGLQLAIHANGDRTQLEICQVLARARQRFGTHPGVRIEHAGNYAPDYPKLSAAWAAAGVVPVPQPIFIRNFGEFVPDYVGQHAWNAQFPFRTMLADGWPISGSSDVWIGSDENQSNPLRSVAATRDRRTFHGQVLGAGESVTPWQGLWMHTAGGAHALGRAGDVGSLSPGAHADFAVLDANPLTVPASELEQVKVSEVYLAGERVHVSRAESRRD